MIRNYAKWVLLGLIAAAVTLAPMLAFAQDATATPIPEEEETPGTFIVILGPVVLQDGAPTLNGFPLVFDLAVEIPVLTDGDVVVITGYLTPENTVIVLSIDVIVDAPVPDVTPTPEPEVTATPIPEVTPTPAPEEESLCNDNHPVGHKLAAEFGVTYEDIMTMFCDGYGFGEIAIAYTLANGDEATLAEIRDLREGGMGWGNIKKMKFDDADSVTEEGDDLDTLTLVVVRGAEGKRGKFDVVEVKDANDAKAKNVGKPDKNQDKGQKPDKNNNGKGNNGNNGNKGNSGKGNNGKK